MTPERKCIFPGKSGEGVGHNGILRDKYENKKKASNALTFLTL